MDNVALTHLIPVDEMTPGQVGAIRNQVISQLVRQVSSELNMAPDKLVVRDVRPFGDLQMYSGGTTNATVERWVYDATTTTAAAYTTVTGAKTMGDQRWVALFGVRDLRGGVGLHTTSSATGWFEATTNLFGDATSNGVAWAKPGAVVTQIKVNVGGSDKVIWDIGALEAYPFRPIAFSPSAVIIPQNAAFNIFYYFKTTQAGIRAVLQLIGVAIEPRGKVVSP